MSKVTDPDSAKMATGKGVIQGYAAQAAVDSAQQIIVAAEVTGSGSEQNMLLPMIEATAAVRSAHALITADAGDHSSDNVNALCEAGIPALVADFVFHGDNTCTCPAGCTLRSSGALYTAGRYQRQENKARAGDCQGCAQRPQCIHKPETAQRKLAVHHRTPDDPNEPLHRMHVAIDSSRGRQMYSQRIATVEPVFGNLRYHRRLSRFTLRGKDKVGTQWRLFCLVHNIEKLAHRGIGREAASGCLACAHKGPWRR